MNLTATVSSLLAQASQPAADNAPEWFKALRSGPWVILVPVLALYLVLTFRNKGRGDRDRDAKLNALKRGDRVQTIGGILGTVVESKDGEVVLKIDESSNTKMRFVRTAIAKVIEDNKAEAK